MLNITIQQNLQKSFFTKLVNTIGVSSEIKPLDPFYTYQMVYSPYDSFWYVGIMTKGGIPYNRKTIIYKISSSLEIIEQQEIPNDPSITNTFD